MTSPVDIAEAVRRAHRYADQDMDYTVPGDASRLARAVIALVEERDQLRDFIAGLYAVPRLIADAFMRRTTRDLDAITTKVVHEAEQRTAEAIAAWLEQGGLLGQTDKVVAAIRVGAWRKS